MALTAGWDSRVLLAASKSVSDKIDYFLDRKDVLPKDHPDVWVAEQLAGKLNLRFEVRNSSTNPPGWFVSLLTGNVTGARVLPKTRMIYDKLLKNDMTLNINGNGGEISRNYYDKNCKYCFDDLTIEEIVRLMGYHENSEFVHNEIDNWRNSLNLQPSTGVNVLDLLYWEQRLGNWGAQFPAEQDIAVEEVSPFNCRLLINLLLATPREERAAPHYRLLTQMIQNMWPEVLAFPINPKVQENKITALKRKIHQIFW